MSASKKSSAKSAKSPAPATKPVKTAAKPAVKTAPRPPAPAAKPKKAAPTPKAKPAAVAAVVDDVAPVAVPAVKPVAPKPVVTTISARIDIGFGNVLSIRGEGAGLSWDQGLAMANVENDLWQVTLGESAQPVIFKFLVNDLSWSTGPDYTIASGASVTLVPEF